MGSLIFGAVAPRAQSIYLWTNTVAASDWNAATNWSPNGVPNGIGNTVYSIGQASTGITMDNGMTFTNGTLSSTNAVSWIIKSGTGTNYLQVASGTPVLNVTESGTECWFEAGYLAGTQGFNKTGAGKVTFRYDGNANTISGNIGILGGTLGIQADYSLGNTNNNIAISNGAMLTEEGSANGGVFWLSPSRTITLAGTQAGIGVLNSAYTLVIPCLINENPVGSGLLWSSTGELVLSNANTFTGPMTMTAGTNDLANPNAVQFSTLTVNGGTLLFDQAVAGNAFTCGGLAGTAGFALQNNAATPAAIALTVGGNNAGTTIAGGLTGPGSLIKTGAGTLVLTGTNTYAGATTISAGKLVSTTASVGGGSFSVADGATNNVQIAAIGQTLTNSSLTLGTSAGATKVNVYGPALAYSAGTIPLLAYTAKSGGGSWALNSLPAGMTATLNDTGSLLQLIISSVSNNVVSEMVSFSSTNAGYAINPAFCGLSYEKSQLTGGLFVNNNTSLINVFSQIGPAVLRIGGSSTDGTCWGDVSNLTAITPAQVDAFAGFVRALPTNWHVIYGINLVVNSPTNCAAEAAYSAAALGSRLLGFEIGNEPDLYHDNTNYFPSNYSYSSFLPSWRALAAGITNAVPGWAMTNGGNGWALTGPASSWNTAGYTMPFATNEAEVISMVTQHYYRNSASATNATMAVLLTLDTNLAATVSHVVGAATANHLPLGFRMDESGSFSGGGNSVSSEYGVALWTLDVMFTEATLGCQGVNFHGGWDGTYSPIWTEGSSVVGIGPEFYGLKLFSLAALGSAVPAVLWPNPSVNFTAYGVRLTNGATGAILINKETNIPVQATINLGTNVAAAQPMVLIGPALDSTSGYTLGGATINPDGSWSGGFQRAISATNGQLTITVMPMSAVWLNPVLSPMLAALTNRTLIAGGSLSVTNHASDPNVPALALAYTLSTAPSGAGINATSGIITWRPLIAQGGTSNHITVAVTDTAGASATQSFWVGLTEPQKPAIATTNSSAGRFLLTISGDTGPEYTIQGATNLGGMVWQTLVTSNAPILPFQWADTNPTRPQFFYRVLLGP